MQKKTILERWLSGRKRLPAKQVSGGSWITSSNLVLSTILRFQAMDGRPESNSDKHLETTRLNQLSTSIQAYPSHKSSMKFKVFKTFIQIMGAHSSIG